MGGSVVSVISARPDGGTSIALGLASVLSRTARVLLIDLAPRPEVAPLLDVDEVPNVYELSFLARLSPVGASDLEAHVQWKDGLGVLAGIWLLPWQREEITDTFVDGLIGTATSSFDHVVVDLGRPRAGLPPALTGGALLWVVTPRPLGMAALDRALVSMDGERPTWPQSAKVLLNRVDGQSMREAERFIEHEYDMPVVGRVPAARGWWEALERRHSLAAFCVPNPDRRRYLRDYGGDAWEVRRALERLAETLLPERSAAAI